MLFVIVSNGNDNKRGGREEQLQDNINHYIETAEKAFNKGDSIKCLQYVEKCLNIIEKHPYLIKEYFSLYESDILVGSLKALYGEGGDNAVIDFIISLREIDYQVYSEANNNGLNIPSQSEWGYQMYWNWAQLCFDAKIGESALLLLDGAYDLYTTANIQPEYDSINNIWVDDIFIREIQYLIAREFLKDDLRALLYSTQAVLESITKYGRYNSRTINTYNRAYTYYSILTSDVLLSLPEDSKIHLSLSYDEYLSNIQLWRAFQDSIVIGYGNNYLDSLNNDYYIMDVVGGDYNDFIHQIPPSALTYYNELIADIVYNQLGDFDNCLVLLFNRLLVNGINPTDKIFSDIVRKIGQRFYLRGYYDHAFYYLDDYYSTLKDYDLPEIKEGIATELASYAWNAGRYNLAYSYVRSAEQISSKYKGYDYYKTYYDINDLISQLIILSRYYDATRDEETAREYCKIAERIIEENRLGINNKMVDNSSKILVLSESFALNNKDAGTIINEIQKIDTTYDYQTAIRLAYVCFNDGQYGKSKEYLRMAFDSKGNSVVSPNDEIMAYRIQFKSAIIDGDKQLAYNALKKKLTVAKNDFYYKASSLRVVSRANYWNHYSHTLEEFTTDALELGLGADIAYDAALFQKGILRRIQYLIKKNIDSTDDTILKHLYSKYKDALKTNSDSLDYVEHDLMKQYSYHSEFLKNSPISTWKDVQNSLKKNDIAIEFTLAAKNDIKDYFVLSAIILKKEMNVPKIVELCPEYKIKDLLRETRQHSGYSTSYDTFGLEGNDLYNMIWKPLESELKGIKTIYFAPYSVINSINIESLRRDEKSVCLFERYDMIRVSSTEEICNHNKITNTNAVIYGDLDYDHSLGGRFNNYNKTSTSDDNYNELRSYRKEWDPLYNTKQEVEGISSLLSNANLEVEVFTKENGSEESFKSLSSIPTSIIHLATHGYYFNNEDAIQINYFGVDEQYHYISSGIRSGIVFSGANISWKGKDNGAIEDGILTADEIMGMDLSSTDLLVLSACQTALGDTERDDIYGIQRSFKIAGVNTIIMSLWEVDDEATSLMMQSFYNYYVASKNKREAFKAAQLEVRSFYEDRAKTQSNSIPKNKRYNSAFYWAPFIMLD